MNLKLTLLLPGALALAAASTQAGSVVLYNFDGSNPDYRYGYTYSEFGSGTHDNGIISPTGGVGGTAGFMANFNTTAMSGGWAGIGAGIGSWAPIVNYSPFASARTLADITLSLDARAGGLTGTSAGVKFELKFEAPDNTIGPNDADTDTDVLLTLTSTPTLTPDWQSFTSTLDSWTVAGGSFAQLQTYVGQLGNLNFNVAYDANGALPAFGNDAGNFLAVDNLDVTVVPEPSTLALLGLGGAALLIRRRR